MLPPLSKSETLETGQEEKRVKHSIPDSDDSEHEQVEFIEDFPKSGKTLKTTSQS